MQMLDERVRNSAPLANARCGIIGMGGPEELRALTVKDAGQQSGSLAACTGKAQSPNAGAL